MKGIVDETELDENLHKWFKEKWVRFGPDGKIRGDCARGDDSEGKPKCLPQKKAQNLGKKGRKYAASKKRREDPNPERTGKAKNVATKKKTNEEKCPECGGAMYPESMINEKQDACYRKVKSRYKVWPSAYASGALVQCRKKGASNWGNSKKNENSVMKGIVDEAGSAAQQAAIAISKKKKANVGEAKAKPYVKPFIENGKQVGWKSSDGYHVKYWRLADSAKAKAYQHAKISPDEVQEDYTGEFAAEKTPAINPYGGLKDNQFRGAIGEGIAEAREMSPELRAAQQNLLALRNKEKAVKVPDRKERVARTPNTPNKSKAPEILAKGGQAPNPEMDKMMADFLARGGEIKKGRPGKAPPVGRNQASLHIGGAGSLRRKGDKPGQGANYRGDKIVAVEEEQLDEKCWDTHKQVGMKNKGGRQVPNCVPKESAIMKGLKSL